MIYPVCYIIYVCGFKVSSYLDLAEKCNFNGEDLNQHLQRELEGKLFYFLK